MSYMWKIGRVYWRVDARELEGERRRAEVWRRGYQAGLKVGYLLYKQRLEGGRMKRALKQFLEEVDRVWRR